MCLIENFIALRSVTFPTQSLQIVFGGTTALGYRNNVVDFEKEVWLLVDGVSAVATSEVVTTFDEVT